MKAVQCKRSIEVGRICWRCKFWAWSEGVMDNESGDDDRDEPTSEWGSESRHDWRGWQNESGVDSRDDVMHIWMSDLLYRVVCYTTWQCSMHRSDDTIIWRLGHKRLLCCYVLVICFGQRLRHECHPTYLGGDSKPYAVLQRGKANAVMKRILSCTKYSD